MAHVNGIDVDELREFVASVERDPTAADRDPVVIARWAGGDRAEVAFASGEPALSVGGADGPSAMTLLLASLVACDVDLVVSRAALLGVEIESLMVEATGHFNVRRYLGLDAAAGPGYERIAYTIRLKTRGGTSAQLAELRRACEQASPVGDTLQRQVALSLRFDAS